MARDRVSTRRASGSSGASDTTQFEVKALRQVMARLQPLVTVVKGLQMGKTVLLSGERLSIGRDARCGLPLIDPGISRNHARIERHGPDDVRIIDLRSTNGVRVNGEKVQECALKAGDKVQLGPETLLKYRLEDPDEARVRIEQYERSIHDDLTSVYNRRHFMITLNRELAFIKRRGTTSGLILIDIDHFKHINDTHGHRIGDDVLVAISRVLRACTRREDVLARWGGEEFAMLVRGMDLAHTVQAAERIRRRIERLSLDALGAAGEEIGVTASCGVSLLQPGSTCRPEQVLDNADRCLYAAKRRGRNQVVSASAD